MVHLFNNEECLHDFCMRSFKCFSDITESITSMFKKKKFKYLSHSQSNMGPIVSMELALAVASFKVLQVMRWVDYLNSFEIFIFNIIHNQTKAEFKFKKYFYQ